MKAFVINPGSTSTKIALFNDEKMVFSKNVTHDVAELENFSDISSQLSYRKMIIEKNLETENISLEDVDVFVGRGGGLLPMEGGTYLIDNLLLEHARIGANGVSHPAQLGAQLAAEFCKENGGSSFVVSPPDVDEYQDLARMTGIKGIYRESHLHALNQKETAIRHAASLSKAYDNCNFIVCHLGGGVSIAAHRRGKMVDGNDNIAGEGPMCPTRCGSLSIMNTMKAATLGKDLKSLSMKNGGIADHMGFSDARQLQEMAESGDEEAVMVWNTMIYQICKYIGEMAVVLQGEVDGILLGGGLVYSEDLVSKIKKSCEWISSVTAYPGEFEMEAMAAGAARVLTGVEELKKYSGKPIWKKFDFGN